MEEEPVLALVVTPISLSSNGLLKDAGSEEVSATLSLSALICPSWYNDDEDDDDDDDDDDEEEDDDDDDGGRGSGGSDGGDTHLCLRLTAIMAKNFGSNKPVTC